MEKFCEYDNKLYYFLKLVFAPLICGWFRISIKGKENISDEPCIYACNHLSHIDSVCLGAAFPKELYYVAKIGVSKHYLAGPFSRRLNTFYIKRENPSKESLVKIINHLREGKRILMYPAGTRAKDGSIGIIKQGVAWLASQAEVPIVPVAIKGTYKIHLGGEIPFCRKVTIKVGKKIMPNKEHKELTEILRKEISKLFYN